MLRNENNGKYKSTETDSQAEANGAAQQDIVPAKRRFTKMQTALILIGIVATVALGVAGYLVSAGHKTGSIWTLFASLVLYSLSFCLYLQDAKAKSEVSTPQSQPQIVAPDKTKVPEEDKQRSLESANAGDQSRRPLMLLRKNFCNPLVIGKAATATLVFYNEGQEGAYVNSLEYVMEVRKDVVGDPMPEVKLAPGEVRSSGAVAPGEAITIVPNLLRPFTQDDLNGIMSNRLKLCVWGQVKYDDLSGHNHYLTPFSLYLDIRTKVLMAAGNNKPQ